MREKILGLLGLMRRAGAISLGEDNSLAAIRDGKGKILILALDVSENARRRAALSLADGKLCRPPQTSLLFPHLTHIVWLPSRTPPVP